MTARAPETVGMVEQRPPRITGVTRALLRARDPRWLGTVRASGSVRSGHVALYGLGMRLGVDRAFVDGRLIDGDVEIGEDRLIERIGLEPAGTRLLAVPGFIDLQANGFAGVDFVDADIEEYAHAASAMARTGVTTFQPTMISSSEDVMTEALIRLEASIPFLDCRVPGMHIEGPFLSASRCGAHDPADLRAPDLGLARRLIEAGPVAQMTIAPELPGAIDLCRYLAAHGVTVAIGHTEADAAQAHAAFGAGARSVTHLFNAQRPFSHRSPGVVGAALSRSDVFVTVIADRIHLADEAILIASACVGPRLVAITDGISATGMGDGTFPLGGRRVNVSAGEARLDDGTLAGSVVTIDRVMRNLVDVGLDLETAVHACTAAPAELIGLPELGTLSPGTQADVALLDADLSVVRCLVDGDVVFG